MKRTFMLLLAAFMVASPLAAQAPVGYWSINIPGYRTSDGAPVQIVTIVRFLPDHTFYAVQKYNDGGPEVGSSSPFMGQWEAVQAMGQTLICARRDSAQRGVCDYTVVRDSLYFVDHPFTPQTEASVSAIAPELVSGP